MVRSTTPRFPRSFPAMTSTVSPERTSKVRTLPFAQPLCLALSLILRSVLALMSEHLRSERDNLHEVALTQLTRHRPEDSGSARIVLRIDEHTGVLVETDRATVWTLLVLFLPNKNNTDH